ncbi:MAG: family 78 glycoside hydrolase catalytic domain [Propionicimonas sp.]
MTVRPQAPTAEYRRDGLGIGNPRPRLSWTTSAPSGWQQAGYRLEITRGRVREASNHSSSDQVLVRWPSSPLRSREAASVRVQLVGVDGSVSEWSPPSVIECGLLHPADWLAVPVGGGWDDDRDADDRRPALVRREFDVRPGLLRARLYVTAHGLYEAEINGARVGDDALSPGWTVYPERLRYYTYDVIDLLATGRNAIGSWLGDGWYRGRLGWAGGTRNLFGSDQSLIAQLELHYADGSIDRVATDPSWRAAPAPIIESGYYDGELYDARLELAGWSTPGFDETSWTAVAVASRDPATLVAPEGPPVRCTEELIPEQVTQLESGAALLDFGQNLVGRIRIIVRGESGTVITIRTAEVTQEGELHTRPLRGAKSTDRYVLAGNGATETWEPRFTMHGFRYAEVSGWPGDVEEASRAGQIVARVYHTDFARTGWFESSDERLNRLHENVVWSMRGNFIDIPTDCPQRDERLGWTGDLQVFAPSAAYLFNVSGMLSSWLKDVAVEQFRYGTVPWFVPVIPGGEMWTPVRPGAVWGDVAVLTPWTLYSRFGDRGVLLAQYDSAKAWVDQVAQLAGPDHLWDTGFQLGDWLDPTAPPESPAEARTDRYLVATAYFAWSTRTLSRIAGVLERAADTVRYAALADDVRAAFRNRWLAADGLLRNDTQTAYALAICFELVTGDGARRAGARLAELVADGGNRVGTGFAGVNLIADALSSTGQTETAFALLMERSGPSWLSMVDRGATTIWERWDSLLADGTVNPGEMTSFNHYALGSVADWMHRVVAGLAPAAPGYRQVRFAPTPGGGLTSASARHDSPYGRIAIAWRLEGNELVVDTELPIGTTGSLEIADQPAQLLGPGTHTNRGPHAC